MTTTACDFGVQLIQQPTLSSLSHVTDLAVSEWGNMHFKACSFCDFSSILSGFWWD